MCWAKIDVDIQSDAKWYVLQRVIKDETGKAFRPVDICTLFMQYCFASKKLQKPVDVRMLSFDRELLLHNQTFESKDDIDIINDYFVRIGVLTRRYTVAKYYDWNEGDKNAKSQSSVAKSLLKTQSDSQSDFDISQSETQSTRKVYQTKEYYRLQRLKLKNSKGEITEAELEEMEYLQDLINSQKQTSSAKLSQSDFDISQSETQKTQSPQSSPIEIEKEKRKEIEKDFNKEKINKKENDSQRFSKPTLEEIEVYCQERQNNINPSGFFDFYESKGWKVGKEAMKDWKACIRTWEKRQTQNHNNNQTNSNLVILSPYEQSSNARPQQQSGNNVKQYNFRITNEMLELGAKELEEQQRKYANVTG